MHYFKIHNNLLIGTRETIITDAFILKSIGNVSDFLKKKQPSLIHEYFVTDSSNLQLNNKYIMHALKQIL